MGNQLRIWGLFFCFVTAGFLIVGCAPPAYRSMRICPPKESKTQVISGLADRARNLSSLEAKGRCVWQHFEEDKKKSTESFALKMWLNPPNQIRMHGDVAFNARGLDLGANETEFWFAIKPEYNSHYWGYLSEASGFGDLMPKAKLVLEAFGTGGIDSEDDWLLSYEDGFDVLTKLDGNTEVRKIYLYSCDGLVARIEYFDTNGQVTVAVELDNYKKVSADFAVPAKIKFSTFSGGNKEDSFEINLTSIKLKEFTKIKKEIYFRRPSTKNFEHIYQNINGNWIEQK